MSAEDVRTRKREKGDRKLRREQQREDQRARQERREERPLPIKAPS
jgi:hypothetical protein